MFRFFVVLAIVAVAAGFKMQMKLEIPSVKSAVACALAGVFATTGVVCPANALQKNDVLSLSYEQVKGSGLANRCSEVVGEGSINVGGKKLKVTDMCLEPKSWQVEEEVGISKGEPVKEFVNTKLMTRQTYSLDGVEGTMETKDGKLTFTETGGIDYAATTVQTPGGARVPLLFTIKDLVAKGNTGGPIKPGFEMGGSFTVPSYRTGLFLDPKGRGTTTGYDYAVALPSLQSGSGEDRLFNENNKRFEVLKGDIEFAVNKVNAEEGEIGGVFVSNQPSDTDMGGKAPKRILMKGIFYAKLE